MAYQESNISAMSDIIPLVTAFANAQGWTTTSDTIQRPGGGIVFQLSAIDGSTSSFSELRIVDVAAPSGINGHFVYLRNPRLAGTYAAPIQSQVTKLHLFSDSVEEPFLAGVIEFGFNSYRHFYIGNMVKVGDYTGGEVLAANNFPPRDSNISTHDYRKSGGVGAVYKLFASTSGVTGSRFAASGERSIISGGVNIVHVDNADSWRYFHNIGSSSWGFSSGTVNDDTIVSPTDNRQLSTLAGASKVNYSGGVVMYPINFLAPVSGVTTLTNIQFRPVGYPAGVRFLWIENSEPGQVVSVGGEDWKIFPEFSKRPVVIAPYVSGASHTYETSFYVGYAYRIG